MSTYEELMVKPLRRFNKTTNEKLISLNKGYDDIPLTEDSLCMRMVVKNCNYQEDTIWILIKN